MCKSLVHSLPPQKVLFKLSWALQYFKAQLFVSLSIETLPLRWAAISGALPSKCALIISIYVLPASNLSFITKSYINLLSCGVKGFPESIFSFIDAGFISFIIWLKKVFMFSFCVSSICLSCLGVKVS